MVSRNPVGAGLRSPRVRIVSALILFGVRPTLASTNHRIGRSGAQDAVLAYCAILGREINRRSEFLMIAFSLGRK